MKLKIFLFFSILFTVLFFVLIDFYGNANLEEKIIKRSDKSSLIGSEGINELEKKIIMPSVKYPSQEIQKPVPINHALNQKELYAINQENILEREKLKNKFSGKPQEKSQIIQINSKIINTNELDLPATIPLIPVEANEQYVEDRSNDLPATIPEIPADTEEFTGNDLPATIPEHAVDSDDQDNTFVDEQHNSNTTNLSELIDPLTGSSDEAPLELNATERAIESDNPVE